MSNSTKRNQTRKQRADRRLPREFAGVDGEGGDIEGKHEYLMLRAGSSQVDGSYLETGKPLTTYECLAFLADLPDDKIYVAFAFDYDVTMMIRHLPPQKIDKLFDRESRAITDKDGNFTSRYWPVTVGNGEFEIDYLPHKEFRVRRPGEKWRVINDTFTFFQASFVKALRMFYGHDDDQGNWYPNETEEWAAKAIDLIAEGKEQRNEFTYVTQHEREYNNLECNMLEMLMDKFRSLCDQLDIKPSKWQGPGYLVSAVFKREGVPRKQFDDVPDEVWSNANYAYYGGRFECGTYGNIDRTVHQYDINSAYASTYKTLPCLRHGSWERVDDAPTLPQHGDDGGAGGIYFADVTFRHRDAARWYTLPVRSAKGTLLFPRIGRGWYWHPELEEASKYCDFTVHRIYRYTAHCNCRFFDWVYDLYGERDRVGKKSGKGKVLKIVLATIYGKLTQSIGHPAYANPIWAGIIVSSCRAKLISGALQVNGGSDVLMLATDGLFCLEPRDLSVGKALGEWEHDVHGSMFIVMSGIYFLPGIKPKTRGVPQSRIVAHEEDFRKLWADYIATCREPYDLYRRVMVDIPLRNFTSIRVANARGKNFLAGRWTETSKRMVFEWATKRIIDDEEFPNNIAGGALWTRPLEGSEELVSHPSSREIGGKQNYHEYDTELLEQCLRDGPDWCDQLWRDDD